VNWVTTGGTSFASIETDQLLTEVGSGLSSGLAVQVYVERVSGTDPSPVAKIEVDLEGGGTQSGADFTPTLDAWTPITITSSQLTADYNRVKIIFFENSVTGEYNFWFDDLTREGASWDDFESQAPSQVVPANVTTARGESTRGGATIAGGGPTPVEGTHMYGMTWSGEADQSIEVLHSFPTPLDLSGQNTLEFQAYLTGVTLPNPIQAFLFDGSVGAFTGIDTLDATGSWELLVLDLTSIPGAYPGFDLSNVVEVKLIVGGLTDGTLYLDDSNALSVGGDQLY
jgi:hypothetical protein